MTVAENNRSVVLDDIVTIINPKSGPESGTHKIPGAWAPTNRTSRRYGGRADEFFLVFVPKLHRTSNIAETGEHQKAAMRRKKDAVSTSRAKIEHGPRLAVKQKSSGWHVPKYDNELTAFMC
jgi:hypothetical protein